MKHTKSAPRQLQRPDTLQGLSEALAAPHTRTEAERPKRFERIPFGQAALKLSSSVIPGMHLHWISEWHPNMPDRLNQAIQAGYTFVTRQEVQTAPLLGGGTTSDLSERVSRIGGVKPDGSPNPIYLMKIDFTYWIEHQQPVWDRADRIDQTIKRGQFERQQGDRRYIPGHTQQEREAAISITTQLKQGEPDG
jgi:hypothetical protein